MKRLSLSVLITLLLVFCCFGCQKESAEDESESIAVTESDSGETNTDEKAEQTTAPSTSASNETVQEDTDTDEVKDILGGIGVCAHISHGRSIKQSFEAIETVNAPWIRDEVRWDFIEPAVKGRLKMATSAKLVTEAKKRGVNTLVILAYGNPLYEAGKLTPKEEKDSYLNCAMPVRDGDPNTTADDEYFDAYVNHVDFVSKELKGQVDAYEIWNEPDMKGFNAKGATGRDYAALLKAAYTVIKKNDPDALVVGCAMSHDTRFFVDILKAGGGDYMDAVSLHYYLYMDPPEELARKEIIKFTQFLKRYDLEDKPVWLTETGWAKIYVGEEAQAKYTIRNAVLFEDYLRDSGITGQYFAYELHDSSTSANYLGELAQYENSLGLVYNDYTPKIAAKAVGKYNTLVEGLNFTSLTEYDCGEKKTVYVAKYDGKERSAYIMWATGGKADITLTGSSNEIIDSTSDDIIKLEENTPQVISLTDSPLMIDVDTSETLTYKVKGAK